MGFINNLTIKMRLSLLVGVAAVIMLAIGILGLNGIRDSGAKAQSIYSTQMIPTGQLGKILELMEANRAQLVLALQHDPKSEFASMHDHPLKKHTDLVEKNIAEITQLWSEVEPKLHSNEKTLAEEFTKARTAYVEEGLRPAVEKLLADQYHDANLIILQKVNPNFTAAHHSADKLLKLELADAKVSYLSAVSSADRLQNTFITLLILGIGLSVLQAVVTIRGIDRGVHHLDVVVTELAEGNLTCRTGYARKDELGHIAQAVDKMAASFQQIVRDLSNATSQLAAAAEETSAVTEQTSAGIRQQQSETEQVATAMNEMNATVHEVARNASEAAAAAHRADEEAGNGRRVVSQTIEMMDALAREVEKAAGVIHSLDEQSESIGSVLDVIKGIAEQTNLLALNAAIEAARAGEQGRGFAVVADEVRTLASRTQQSTQEIQEMIERLQGGARNAVHAMESGRTQAQAGVDQAAQAGTSLESITRAVGTINDMNTQIASAAEEQSAVAEEINRNIVTISQVADQTSEGSRQTASAAEELANLATQLQSLVNRFRV